MESILQAIWHAFRKVRLEDGISMAQARAMDDYNSQQECRAARAKDKEKSWEDIADDKIEEYCDVLPWLDAKGFRFYLPAFMRWTLRNLDSRNAAGEYVVRALNPIRRTKKGTTVDELCAMSHAMLTAEQKKAVQAFLEFLASGSNSLAADARTALDDYWRTP